MTGHGQHAAIGLKKSRKKNKLTDRFRPADHRPPTNKMLSTSGLSFYRVLALQRATQAPLDGAAQPPTLADGNPFCFSVDYLEAGFSPERCCDEATPDPPHPQDTCWEDAREYFRQTTKADEVKLNFAFGGNIPDSILAEYCCALSWEPLCGWKPDYGWVRPMISDPIAEMPPKVGFSPL
eukprot:g583.t1